MKHQDITQKIIKAFYAVYNTLGYGFLEKVYENAMDIEMRKQGLRVITQLPISVYYDEQVVGNYVADMVVEDCVIVELKAACALSKEHEAQLLNYLNATEYEVGLLFNFGPKPDFTRKIFDNARKKGLMKK